jgi:hypothetical protein
MEGWKESILAKCLGQSLGEGRMASGVSGLSVRTLPGLTADPFEGRGDVCFAHHSILTWPQVCMEASKE